jgi:phosphate transporter
MTRQVLNPILNELPSGARYSKALLLGLAFSCNLGGMLTPISSPQNAVALEALSALGAEISFGDWLCLALPLVQLGALATWLLLCRLYLTPCDVHALPKLDLPPSTLRASQLLMLACVAATIVAWAAFALPPLKDYLGDPALVGLLLVGAAFGSGARPTNPSTLTLTLALTLNGNLPFGSDARPSQP